jgi:hypothetical protein
MYDDEWEVFHTVLKAGTEDCVEAYLMRESKESALEILCALCLKSSAPYLSIFCTNIGL